MHGFPVVGRHHLDGVPGAAVEKRAVRSLADTLLAADTKIRVDFDASKWWMILVGYPEHARFDGTILDARRRAGATGAAIGSDRKYSWPLLASRLPVTLRHGQVFVYDVVQLVVPLEWILNKPSSAI